MDYNTVGAIIVVVGLAAYTIIHFVRAARQERLNDALPIETVRARVKSKNPFKIKLGLGKRRIITFETEQGDMDFILSRQKYAALYLYKLKKGDAGSLAYQGTRFIGFVQEQ